MGYIELKKERYENCVKITEGRTCIIAWFEDGSCLRFPKNSTYLTNVRVSWAKKTEKQIDEEQQIDKMDFI